MKGKKQSTGPLGPADLVSLGVLRDADPSLAEFAGFVYRARKANGPEHVQHDESVPGPVPKTPPKKFVREAYALDPVPFLIPVAYKSIAVSGASSDRIQKFVPHWPNAPTEPPVFLPLANVGDLQHFLNRFEPRRRTAQSIDVPRVVKTLAQAQSISRLPQRRYPQNRRLQLVADRSPRLAPVWRDQRHAFEALSDDGARFWQFDDLAMAFRDLVGDEHADPVPEDGPVIAFTDLGLFGGSEDRRFWLHFAQRFNKRGGDLLAVVPCLPDDIPHDLVKLWSPVSWESALGSSSLHARSEDVEHLLTLVSPLARLEPGLLRGVRRHCTRADAATEVLLWRHQALSSAHAGAASFDPEKIAPYRERFAELAREDPEIARKAWKIIRQWRGRIGAEFMFEEIFDLPEDVRSQIVSESDIGCAEKFWNDISKAAERATLPEDAVHWLQETGYRRSPEAGALWTELISGSALRRAISLIKDPETRTLTVSQKQEALHLSEVATGVNIALMPYKDGIVDIKPAPEPATLPPPLTVFRDPMTNGRKGPEMVSIPTGSFMMGSPETEAGRWPDEGPQHSVEIAAAFALAKNPVTFEEFDAFCEATDREKPEDFGWGRGRRPVIGVNWLDAQAFCAWLAEETGEAYRLPSEAEWEYACRAGTASRYWWGDAWAPKMANADRRDSKTTIVEKYQANPWRLHDMLGNVWEWCADVWSESHEGADPTGLPRPPAAGEASQRRVVRGGSWNSLARRCRAASRDYDVPDSRNRDLGFRPARGQVGMSSGKAGGARTGSGPEGRIEPAEDGVSKSADRIQRLRVTPGAVRQAAMPAGPFVIRTDLAELTVARQTLDDLSWAHAAGRDPFGLWAEFAVGEVTQRLRYCPPGRFLMGSPEKGPGRFDQDGPQTDITFSEGFWLFETPVTQALYEAVIGENPSRFVSPTRPVERVSFEQAEAFVERLNGMVKELDLVLPSEAMWEYACRAGTTMATYAGELEIKGLNTAPALDPIAWYGGNSGVDLDLETGVDAGWSEKQFESDKAASRVVKLKNPNPWGLYDMLGNVWEWCADVWSERHDGADPTGQPRPPEAEGASVEIRVVRGGSWHNFPEDCRAASRDGVGLDDRHDDLGFRPARGQVGMSSSKAGGARTGSSPEGRIQPATHKTTGGEKSTARGRRNRFKFPNPFRKDD